MAVKFKNKYRTDSTRLKHWDYGNNGAYFITICTADRAHFFGEITNQHMQLNPTGEIANDIWMQITNQFEYAKLGDFIIMPNHMHGILIIDKTDGMETTDDAKIMDDDLGSVADSIVADDFNSMYNFVEARLIAPLRNYTPPNTTPKQRGGITGDNNPMLHQNISRIIRWYKGRCTYEIRKFQADFAWQSRFYDHIIRSNKDYQRISNYIIHNPKNWKTDTFCKND